MFSCLTLSPSPANLMTSNCPNELHLLLGWSVDSCLFYCQHKLLRQLYLIPASTQIASFLAQIWDIMIFLFIDPGLKRGVWKMPSSIQLFPHVQFNPSAGNKGYVCWLQRNQGLMSLYGWGRVTWAKVSAKDMFLQLMLACVYLYFYTLVILPFAVLGFRALGKSFSLSLFT